MPSTRRGGGEAGKPAAKKARARKTTSAAGKLTVKQVKSGIGHADTYRRTLAALGLRHHQQTVTVSDNPSVRGMLFKVRHLVEVSPVQEG
jgi:large subunit ribosomal protein L30